MTAFVLSMLAFFVFLMLESVTSWIFIKGSKKKHPLLWKHAGKPTLLGNGDLMSAYPLIRYIWQREYAQIEDQNAIRYADKLRYPTVLSYWLAWASIAALIVSLFFIEGSG